MYRSNNIDEYIEQLLPSPYDNFSSCDPEFDAVDDDLGHELAAIRHFAEGEASWA